MLLNNFRRFLSRICYRYERCIRTIFLGQLSYLCLYVVVRWFSLYVGTNDSVVDHHHHRKLWTRRPLSLMFNYLVTFVSVLCEAAEVLLPACSAVSISV